MEEHSHRHPLHTHPPPVHALRLWRLALSATLHCLLGCSIGEATGMFIGMALSISNMATIILAIGLGFIGGFALGIVPLLKSGFSFGRAFKQVLIAETLSIVVMEGVEVIVAINIPGAMDARATDPLFWGSMILGLIAGFAAAYPVNYILISKGIRHQH
ncbi:MAG: DUF4396 domain-containing protein [Deltaproteobacteria bacterium]|nr:DUF4396 domain-containing protein [Deltaproteobacteria bacterium]